MILVINFFLGGWQIIEFEKSCGKDIQDFCVLIPKMVCSNSDACEVAHWHAWSMALGCRMIPQLLEIVEHRETGNKHLAL